MYDYLAKVILLGPSGAGKFVRPASNQLFLGSFLSGPVCSIELSKANVTILFSNYYFILTIYRACALVADHWC